MLFEVVFLTFSLFWIINCCWCVRHGLDYLVVCSLCRSAAAIKINLCLFIFSLLAQCHNVLADPCFALHVRELFSPTGSDSDSSWSAGRLTRSVKSDCNFPCPAFRLCHDQRQPPSIPASPLDHRLKKIVSAMISVSPRRSRPPRLITALKK